MLRAWSWPSLFAGYTRLIQALTDKSLEVSLATRRVELKIEKSAQSIALSTYLPRNVTDSICASRYTSDRLGLTEPIETLQTATLETISVATSPCEMMHRALGSQ
jgi:hypothetical protein